MSGHCSFCQVWHSGGCFHPGRSAIAALEQQVVELTKERDDYKSMYLSLTGETYANPIEDLREQLATAEEALKAVEADRSIWIQAVGLASTCAGDMEIDVTKPIEMMQEVCRRFQQHEEALRVVREAAEAAQDEMWTRKGYLEVELQQLRRLVGAWTKDRPKESGYYWLRDGSAILLVQVDIGTFDAFFHETVRWHGSTKKTQLGSINGEWCGPIPAPTLDAAPNRLDPNTMTEEQRCIDNCCDKPHDCKWGGPGGCGYERRKHELKRTEPEVKE